MKIYRLLVYFLNECLFIVTAVFFVFHIIIYSTQFYSLYMCIALQQFVNNKFASELWNAGVQCHFYFFISKNDHLTV